MSPRHIALAVLVAAVWGLNFVLIHVGLENFPPLLFCALRFAVVALPAIFLVGPPKVAARWILAVGLVLGVVKFGLLFLGMHAGIAVASPPWCCRARPSSPRSSPPCCCASARPGSGWRA